ncbi:MAG: glycosyltransferase [Pauljensenia sp.]
MLLSASDFTNSTNGLAGSARDFSAGRHSHNIDLHLAGSGPLERDLRKLATPLAAQIHIGFIPSNELIALLARADIYVHCALVEIEGLLLQTLTNYRRK